MHGNAKQRVFRDGLGAFALRIIAFHSSAGSLDPFRIWKWGPALVATLASRHLPSILAPDASPVGRSGAETLDSER
jgi:hypothetical protein